MDKNDYMLDDTSLTKIDDLFFIIDNNGIIKNISEGIESMWTYKAEDLVGRCFYDLISENNVALSSRIIEHIRSQPNNVFSLRLNLPHIDGTLHPFIVSFCYFMNNENSKDLIVHIKDNIDVNTYIHDLKKLHLAVEHSPASIIITDTNGKIEYTNFTFNKLTGYSKEEVMGKNPRLLKSGHHSAEFYKDLWDTISSGDPWVGELLNKKKNGELYWESAQIAPLKNSHGKIVNFVAIKQDITELKMAHRELEKQRNELSDFAHTVAHDIRNPITIINAYAQMLDEDYDSDLAKKIIEKTKEIDDFIKKSLTLADAGKTIGDQKIIDLNVLVHSIAKDVVPDTISYSQNELPCIVGDYQRIKQIFQNILSNAVVHGHPSSINVRSNNDGDFIHIFISNNGIPIDPELSEMIFEKGFTTDKDCTGLGLYIVKKLVDSVGGIVRLSCDDGETVFEVSYPSFQE